MITPGSGKVVGRVLAVEPGFDVAAHCGTIKEALQILKHRRARSAARGAAIFGGRWHPGSYCSRRESYRCVAVHMDPLQAHRWTNSLMTLGFSALLLGKPECGRREFFG